MDHADEFLGNYFQLSIITTLDLAVHSRTGIDHAISDHIVYVSSCLYVPNL